MVKIKLLVTTADGMLEVEGNNVEEVINTVLEFGRSSGKFNPQKGTEWGKPFINESSGGGSDE